MLAVVNEAGNTKDPDKQDGERTDIGRSAQLSRQYRAFSPSKPHLRDSQRSPLFTFVQSEGNLLANVTTDAESRQRDGV